MATGDIRIDSLLALPGHSLASNHTLGATVEITYSFNGYTADQARAISLMLAEISSLVGVNFRQVDQMGLLSYSYYTNGPTLADGSPSTGYMSPKNDGATVFLNATQPAMQNLASGYGRQVALHETGHALGLKHPGQYSSSDNGPYLSITQATANHTIMAYNGGNTEHLGDYDILALQYLYGGPRATSQPITNSTDVNASYTAGSYFNDLITLDVTKVTSSVNIVGLTGIDKLRVNLASSEATFQGTGLDRMFYKKADGAYEWIVLDSVERIQFIDRTLALDINGSAGQIYRLYKAAFDRVPDKEGLGFWIDAMDRGVSLESVALGFVVSPEFKALNGENPTNFQFVTSLYQHVLGRASDQSGQDFWVNQLDSNGLNRSQVLYSFSESSENKIAVTGQIQGGIEYLPV